MTQPLLNILHNPRSLVALIAFIDWSDLVSLLSTCYTLRINIFAYIPTRDAILCRFVPGFSFCLKHRDLQFYQDVPVTIHDLDLFLISQRTDLHRYPTHALRTLTASAITDTSLVHTTSKLIRLTQAHSRFVLLFQSLVHSSPSPIPPDPPEDRFVSAKSRLYDPSPELTFPPPLAFTADDEQVPPPPPPKARHFTKSRKKHKHSFSHPGTFPQSQGPTRKPSASPYVISPSPSLTHRHNPRHPSSPSYPQPSSHSRSHSQPKRRLSIFGKSHLSPPPPPPEEPETLRIRAREWRRARSARSISSSAPAFAITGSKRLPFNGHKLSASLDNDAYAAYPSDSEFDFGELRRPKRLFVEHDRLDSSSDSSISIRSETRSSWNQGQGSNRSSRSSPPIWSHYPKVPTPRNQTPIPGNRYPNPTSPFAPSIHSLLHATIRNRAPILRVFVPTQHMHPTSSSTSSSFSSSYKDPSPLSTASSSPERTGQLPHHIPPLELGGKVGDGLTAGAQPSPQYLASLSIQACEAQLQEAGLWEHLSTGDVVCNFGYIPLDDGESDPLYTPKVLAPSHRPSLRSFSHLPRSSSPHPSLYPNQSQSEPLRTWLIFTGHSLLPYTPPSLLPLPSSSPLSLPSPFYYYHIMPAGLDPLFQISELPPLVPLPMPPSHRSLPPLPNERTRTTGIGARFQPPNKSNPNISLALIQSTSLIPSTLSPTGYVKVNKFSWTARVLRTRLPVNSVPLATNNGRNGNGTYSKFDPSEKMTSYSPPPIPGELGDGWLGEWILEYEGTSEGRELLLAALEGKFLGRGRVWEVRREMSGGGRVWMRLLPE